MPPLIVDAGLARKTRIAREIESRRSIIEHGAVDALEESVVIEVINGAGYTGDDIRNSLGKVRIPSHP